MIVENFKYEYGCVMGILNSDDRESILKINKHLIPDEILYNEDGEEYGRETESHVTIKFGLTKEYSKSDMGKVFSNIKPFSITFTKIDIFENDKFDVVKFNVVSETLHKLNFLFSKLPNEDKYPIYHPHSTLAYVKRGEGSRFVRNIKPISVEINKIKYSTPTNKYFYNL